MAPQWELHFRLQIADLDAKNGNWSRAEANLAAAEQCAAEMGAVHNQVRSMHMPAHVIIEYLKCST
jgi:hypothetical protein